MTQNQKKSDDLQLTKVTLSGEAHTDPNACSSNSSQGQVLASQSHLELSEGTRCSSHASVVDPYSFMGEELHMHSPSHRHLDAVTTGPGRYGILVSNDTPECLSREMYRHSQQSTTVLEQTDSSSCGINFKPMPKKRGRKKKLVAVNADTSQMTTPVDQQK